MVTAPLRAFQRRAFAANEFFLIIRRWGFKNLVRGSCSLKLKLKNIHSQLCNSRLQVFPAALTTCGGGHGWPKHTSTRPTSRVYHRVPARPVRCVAVSYAERKLLLHCSYIIPSAVRRPQQRRQRRRCQNSTTSS